MLVNLWPKMWTKAVLLMNVWAKWKCAFFSQVDVCVSEYSEVQWEINRMYCHIQNSNFLKVN